MKREHFKNKSLVDVSMKTEAMCSLPKKYISHTQKERLRKPCLERVFIEYEWEVQALKLRLPEVLNKWQWRKVVKKTKKTTSKYRGKYCRATFYFTPSIYLRIKPVVPQLFGLSRLTKIVV